jgi:PadR family transcriptional regulator PadR
MKPATTARKQKPRGGCARHNYPCTCAMGHLYRFVEPVLLLMLKERGRSHGYDLSEHLAEYAFTDAEIERAVLYRTLRRFQENGYVRSNWRVDAAGPARRVYALTKAGERHLREWGQVLTKVAVSMDRFVERACGNGSLLRKE